MERIGSSRVQRVFVDRVARVMGFTMGSSEITIKPSDFGFGSPESPLEPPFVDSVHCTTGRGFWLPALSRSLSLSFPLNLPESLSQLSLLLGLSLTLNLSVGRSAEERRRRNEEERRKGEEEKKQSWTAVHREEKRRKRKERKEKERQWIREKKRKITKMPLNFNSFTC
jgi:hypothetical protein